MKYFLLEADKRNHIPYAIDKNRAIDIRYVNQENAYRIPNCSVVDMEVPLEVYFPGILSEPIFMVNEQCATVIEMYQPETIFKTVYLLQSESGMNATYFLPILESIECLADEAKVSRGGKELLEIVLREEMIFSKAIFRIAGFDHSYVIGRLDFVESIMRRSVEGLKLTEIMIM